MIAVQYLYIMQCSAITDVTYKFRTNDNEAIDTPFTQDPGAIRRTERNFITPNLIIIYVP